MIKAVLLDRDGTINVDKGFVYRSEDFEFLPRAVDAMKSLYDNGYRLFVVTNQSGIGRGLYTEQDVYGLHVYMLSQLRSYGVIIDGIFYCPHDPSAGCGCRKPAAGLLEKAILDFDIDVSRSYMVGDNEKDVEAGRKVGLRTAIVGRHSVLADYSCADLYEASQIILGVKA